MRLYGRRFWAALALGIGPVSIATAISALPARAELIFALTGGALVLTGSYVSATLLAADVPLRRRSGLTAFAAGVLVFLPVPFLTKLFIFPGVVWLALFGLAVPVALIERLGVGASLGRALTLARADFAHALGSLAALAIVGYVSAITLSFLFTSFGDQASSVAAILPLLVVSPLLLLGAALLYFDQEARLRAK
jgi:hypothetical protein